MSVESHGIKLSHLIAFIVFVNCTIAASPFIPLPLPLTTSPCLNISVNNVSFGRIHSLNFFAGQSQPPNVSCSWTISNYPASVWSSYLLSLRVLEIEKDPTHWSNELSFWTGNRQISIDEATKRTYLIPTTSSSLQIFFRTKVPLLQTFNPYIRTNSRIRRFLIEFIHLNNDLAVHDNDGQYFRCQSSGVLIPKQWRCNCIYECSYDDHSDEEYCPLCSMYEPSTSLLCQSNEIWCLPKPWKPLRETLIDDESEEDTWMAAHLSYSRRIDPKGVCVPRDDHQKCAYSTNTSSCQTVLAWRQDHGQILLDNVTLHNYQTLCFVIIAKDEYKIKMLLNQYEISNEHPDLEWMIYDGSEAQEQLLLVSNRLLTKETVQTRRSHIATIIIRQRSTPSISDIVNTYHGDEDVLGHLDTKPVVRRRRAINGILLNITWFTSICPDDQMLCGGHFETKCYTAEQRCDGIWDCISGDDEIGCSPESCPTTFACNDRLRLPTDQPRCYTGSERCNGNAFCANRTDERLCNHWWCNSNNGTFLCKNLNCIYETWVCDGTDDCGDRSDETNCPSRVPRRIVTAAVIGATVCSTLFIIALGCTCKLFHLRTAERRAASRLLNPQRYIEQRRQQLQREQQRCLIRQQTSVPVDPSAVIASDTRRIAPPSYNQTMGLSDENEERHAALSEHLRLAGLANYISLPPIHSSSRSSRSTSRHRHRRHRRHRHHHHHRRAHSEGSRVALLEPNVVVPNAAFSHPSTSFSLSRFNQLRSQLRSFFTTTRSTQTNPNPPETRERRHRSRPTSVQPLVLSTRPYSNSDFIHPRELPPPYTPEQFVLGHTTGASLSTALSHSRTSVTDSTDIESINPIMTTTTNTATTTSSSSSLYRLRKRQLSVNTLRDRMRQFISGSAVRLATDELNHPMQPTTTNTATLEISLEQAMPSASIEDEEQPSSDDDKMLTP